MLRILLTAILVAPAASPRSRALCEDPAPPAPRHAEEVERARALIEAGQTEPALAILRGLLETELAELAADDPRIVQAQSNLAYALLAHGAADEAREAAYLALQRCESLAGPPVERAMVARLLAEINEAMGELGEAQIWIDDACRDLASSFGRTPMAAETHEIGARIAFQAGELEAAQEHAERALAIYERFLGAANEVTARPLAPLAAIVARQGRPRSSVLLHRTARRILDATVDADAPELMANLESEARLLLALGEESQAARTAGRLVASLVARAGSEELEAGEGLELTLRAAALLLETGSAQEAARLAATALAELQSRDERSAFDELRLLIPLAHARLFQGDAEGALQAAEGAALRADAETDPQARVAAETLRGRVLLEMGRDEGALEVLRGAWRLIDEAGLAGPSRLDVVLALLRAEERAKGASVGLVDLVEMAEEALAETPAPMLSERRREALRRGETSFLGGLAQAWMRLCEADGGKLPEAFAALERVRAYERAAAESWRVSPAASLPEGGLEELRGTLADDSQRALRFVWTDVDAWVILAGREASGDRSIRLGACAELAPLVARARRGLAELDPELDLRPLALALLAPLEPHLRGVQSVRIVADGPLAFLPFEALPTSEGRPWIDGCAVRYATGLGASLGLPVPGQEPRTLRFCEPTPHAELSLSHAVASLRERFRSAPVVPAAERTGCPAGRAAGAGARETRLRELSATGALRGLRLLELDLPTFLDGSVPSATGIACSPEAEDDGLPGWRRADGFLDVIELEALDLSRSRVFLPRVERELAPDAAGASDDAGLVALTEALRAAGACELLLSGWPCSSEAARAFEAELRERATSGGEPDVLLAAQRAWLQRARAADDVGREHPGVWARFRRFGG